jgi:hypothetical protein
MEFNLPTQTLIKTVSNILESNGLHQSFEVTQRWEGDGVYILFYDLFYLTVCGNDNPHFNYGVDLISNDGNIQEDATGQVGFYDGESLMNCIRHNYHCYRK